MSTLVVAIASFVGFIVAYHTYGHWLASRIFQLDPKAKTPSHELQDGVDFVPTKKEVIFGHHFTSIAGTGPIVGPAIAVYWGWLPALLWVVLGSIFIGAVHDFGALIVSLRNRGQTVGEVAGRLISPRARVLFLAVLAVALTIVLAIFGLVIANIFAFYPESVLSVWIEIPIAVAIGFWVYKRGGGLLVPSLIALGLLYAAVLVGVYWLPIDASQVFSFSDAPNSFWNPIVFWTLLLLSYCFVASVLPVWVLLQPRDYINSHQLVVALGLLVLGLLLAGALGRADLVDSAPALAEKIPADAPPIWPFLFITIACGAVSGFHCMVSSGTSSKQVENEADAKYVGYGAMLLEGALAVVVILSCCAGVGMGVMERQPDHSYQPIVTSDGAVVTGEEAWRTYYPLGDTAWKDHGLREKLRAFIEGGANFIATLGVPFRVAIGIVAVLVASFAATTLDTATRLQRYVIQELAGTLHVKPFTNKYVATALAVGLGGAVALFAGFAADLGPGKGGLVLWPLFGATNQLLAGLAFMVTVFYLWRRNKPIIFAALPMIVMLIMPAWAMCHKMQQWWAAENMLLFAFGFAIMGLQVWMIVEGLLVLPRVRGVLEEAMPPLPKDRVPEGGRSC
ncbi:MAG TPA: carbon starvation protein A [Planctomycetaceae bacterium]|nr:carbon starvation protein A [Planctomycetaceae bacterium]